MSFDRWAPTRWLQAIEAREESVSAQLVASPAEYLFEAAAAARRMSQVIEGELLRRVEHKGSFA